MAITSALAVAAFAALAPLPRQECEFAAERSANIAGSASDVLDLVARAGSLRVEGRPGLREVRVRGRACASSNNLLDQLVLETRRSGDRVRVEVPDIDDGRSFFGNNYARLDLVIEVPEGMEAEVTDGSGEAEFTGLGRLNLTDGSGSLYLANMLGDVRIEDGSGEIEIVEVDGNVYIDDGSGEISVRNVAGSVTVNDGSGSIRVADVRGDFTVESDGSGGITHRNVSGAVDIPEDDRRRRRRR
jgi:DUF4097 and DUF4098 domain-containing protein YvlB